MEQRNNSVLYRIDQHAEYMERPRETNHPQYI